MANIQIEGLASAATPLTDTTQYLEVSQSAVTKKILISDFWTYIAGKITAAGIAALPAIAGLNGFLLRVNLAGNAVEWVKPTTPNAAYKFITASAAILATDEIISVAPAGATTITLPDATTCQGHLFTIKRTLITTAITVATVSSQTIDGAATLTVATANYTVVRLRSNGTNWDVN